MLATRRRLSLIMLGIVFTSGCGILSEVELVLNQEAEPRESKPVEIIHDPDELLLPTLDELDAWTIAPAPPFAPRRALIANQNRGKLRFWGARVCPEANRAVLTFTGDKIGDARQTFAVLCNVANGKTIARWEVPEMADTHAIHPSGNIVLMGRANGVRSHRERLYVSKIGAKGGVKTREWMPLVDPSDVEPKLYVKEQEIMWADFLSDAWIVTLNGVGQLHLWNLHDQSRYAMVRDVIGEPTLTPDGNRVLFLKEDSLCVLDPRQRAIIGSRRIDEIPEDAQLSVHPSGKFIAIAGKGQTTMMELQTGRQEQLMMSALRPSKGRALKSTLGWTGNYIHSQRALYDFDSPIAVWKFGRTEWGMPIGNAYWAVIRPKRSKDYVIRSYNVPHKAISKKVEAALRSNDILALRRGDPVKVDVSGLPAERQSGIASTLKARLIDRGFRVSDRAAVTVVAELDEKPKEMSVRYYILEGMQVLPSRDAEWLDMTYTRRRAWLRFRRDGKDLWAVNGWHSPPSHVKFSQEESTSGSAGAAFGNPDYSIYSERRLPEYLRSRGRKQIGSTDFLVNGMKHR